MAVLVSPFGPKPQILLSTGLPAVGGQLFFYVAGSVNTKQNTYTDSTGGSANTNPLVLNSLGEPTTEIWFTAGQSYKVVYAPSTDTDPPTSPIWTIDNLSGINDVTGSVDQWVAGPVPTYISATSFSLVGDQTGTFQVGRRVRTTNSGGTVYSRITVSAFAAVTTVTVVNDSGTLDSGLSAVSYGLLSATNPSIPKYAGFFTSITNDGLTDISGAAAGQIKFPSTQNPSSNKHTLDDYLEDVFTVTLTGVTTTVTGTVNYTKIGNSVTIDVPTLSGTSNAISKTGTGMPAALRPTTTKNFLINSSDNGGANVIAQATLDGAGLLTFFPTPGGAAWTNAGTASVQAFSLSYTLT